MTSTFIKIFSVAVFVTFSSCQSNSKDKTTTTKSEDTVMEKIKDTVSLKTKVDSLSSGVFYAEETTNEEIANKLKQFLLKKYEADLNYLQPNDRKFSFYSIDLNDDTKPEYLVSLYGSYFCGTGGCSYYLLNSDFSVNTYFSVTNPPIFRSSRATNGWHDLILKGNKGTNGDVLTFIHLKYDKQKQRYPSNPSMIKPNEIAPSGHDFIMWDENFSNAKIFDF